MKAAGGAGAAGLLGTTTVSGQQSGDNVIKLAAVREPTDPDNDGLYEDVNGDGSMTQADVTELFQKFDKPEIQNQAEKFDFNQNNRLDYDDIVTLRNEVEGGSSGSGSDSGSGSGQTTGEYAWLGVSPDSISGQTNPTLSLTAGTEYTVEWTNRTGKTHNFVIVDANGNELVSTESMGQKGETQSVTFTASDEMAAYYSDSHAQAMRGSIAIGTDDPPEPTDDMISVLFMGGPMGGSHNAPARQLQITEYMLNRGIEVLYTDRLADLKSDTLHRYDAWIMFDNRSGLTQAQEDSIVNFVENGGGFVPIHSASACFTESEAYLDLVGGQFADHNYGQMTTTFARPDHPILSNLDPIVTKDETYRHKNLRDDINILAYAQFSEGDTIPQYDQGREQGEPWSWTRTQGDGRVFYTAWGHGRGPWAEPGFKALIENGLRWVTGNENTIADDTRVLDQLNFKEANIPYYPPPADSGIFTPPVPEEVGSGTNWKRMQEALDPQGTIDRTIMPEGFDLQPFVTEDMLPEDAQGNILDTKFDEQGRVWMAVSRDYPNSLGENRDKIVICEDTDSDGQADDFTIFAEDISIPASMVLTQNGVLVAHLNEPSENSGQLLHIEDTDGDDQANQRNVVFSGYGTSDTHAGPNELIHSLGNWIWGQVGYSGFSGTIAGQQREFSSAVYRFKLDDSNQVSDFEIVAQLPGNQAGVGFTEEGLAFASVATAGRPSNYLPIPNSYYELINGTSPTDFGAASDTNRFLPVTNRVRQVDNHGGYTAAAGHTIYTAREYPQKYWNNTAFVGDGTGHILGTFYLNQEGADYSTHYAHNMAGSTDAWFAPTYSDIGPEGMMWFLDLYNYIFQHNPTPEGFETGIGNAYKTQVRDHATARFFRATYGDNTGYQPADLSGASSSRLVKVLSNDNMFWRLTAQRMLIERDATGVTSDLASLVTSESTDEIGLDPGAIHALWTLEGLGALDADSGNDLAISTARGAFTHPSAGVQINALRSAPKTAATRDAILENDLLNDQDKRVAMWALLALAQTPESEAAGQAVYQMISQKENYQDTILVDAASIAAAQHSTGFISAYKANEDTSQPDPGEQPNLFQNPSMEKPADGGSSGNRPASWETMTYSGTAKFGYTSKVARMGEDSVKISSSKGADASWTQFVSDLKSNAEYTFSVYVRTSGDFTEAGGYGVTLNVHSMGQEGIKEKGTNYFAGPVDGWQKLKITVTTGGNPGELQFNLLYGGFGNATGTVWFDDASLKQTGGFGNKLQTVYKRVQTHVEKPNDGGGNDGGGTTTIDPSTTIKLGGEVSGWKGRTPSSIAGQTNPTLRLQEGATYIVKWENVDGAPHDINILDKNGNEIVGTQLISSQGKTQTLEFTVTSEMAEYYCSVHPGTMRGTIELGGGGSNN